MPDDMEELALTVCGKKSRLTRKDFLLLAENLTLPRESALRVLEFYKRKEQDILSCIQESFLSEVMRETYRTLSQL